MIDLDGPYDFAREEHDAAADARPDVDDFVIVGGVRIHRDRIPDSWDW